MRRSRKRYLRIANSRHLDLDLPELGLSPCRIQPRPVEARTSVPWGAPMKARRPGTSRVPSQSLIPSGSSARAIAGVFVANEAELADAEQLNRGERAHVRDFVWKPVMCDQLDNVATRVVRTAPRADPMT